MVASGQDSVGAQDDTQNPACGQDFSEPAAIVFARVVGEPFESVAECFRPSPGPEKDPLALRVDPKVILLDIQMPEMDGFETCRRLRGMFLLKTVPVAFLTARKSSEDVREGLAAGGNDFIVKPFDPEKLLARVDHWMGRRITA